MVELSGFCLWELDRHHGEQWESRLKITASNPTTTEISKVPSGWALFRWGINHFWEDETNAGRLTVQRVMPDQIYGLIANFYNIFEDNDYVCGLFYTRQMVSHFSFYICFQSLHI